MKNTTPICGFQFNLFLPEGVTPETYSNGTIKCTLAAERREEGDQHTISVRQQQDGSYLFLCGSEQANVFKGNDGVVANLQVNIDENMDAGEYPLKLRKIKLTETNISHFYHADNIVLKLIVKDYMAGDISGDGSVDVSDYIGVANYILGSASTNFNAKAADVNNDNVIDVSDYIGIANIILTGSAYGDQANAAPLHRATTDVSTMDNVIYIEPFAAKPGATELPISFKMKNTTAIRGFQFDLTLPEGVTPATYGNGTIKCSLTDARKPEGDQHTLSVVHQTGNTYRFLCGSQQFETFLGNDGEIATLLVNIDANMAEDDYALLMTDMKLTETNIDNYYETAQIETTMTISAAADGRILLDETSTDVPTTAATNVNVRVMRTINANEWSTICLPFDMTEAQVKTAFGDDVQLKDFTGYDTVEDAEENIVGITVNFVDAAAIEANHPYLIKVPASVSEFTVDGVDIDPEEEPTVSFGFTTGKGSKAVYHPIDFNGTYTANTLVPENDLFLSGNKFWYSTGATSMKAFRAYFEFDDVLTEVDEAVGARIVMSFGSEDGTTGIVDNKREAITSNSWYTLDGRKLDKKPTAKGVYVKEGRKVVIK